MPHSIPRHQNKPSQPALRVALALMFAIALALGAAPNQQLPRAGRYNGDRNAGQPEWLGLCPGNCYRLGQLH